MYYNHIVTLRISRNISKLITNSCRFGTLLSGKSVKQINYTEINRRRVYEREKLRIRNRSIREIRNETPKHMALPESVNPDPSNSLMHYTKVLINNNLPQSQVDRLINPIGHFQISKLGTRSITALLSFFIQKYPNNNSTIKKILKEIIRRFNELDQSELSHIAYCISIVDRLKFDGLIENFANRLLLHKFWHFTFSELSKILYFSALQSISILFDKSILHLPGVDIYHDDPHVIIKSAYFIAKSLELVDSQYLSNYYILINNVTKKCSDILRDFNSKLDSNLIKSTHAKSKNIIFDISIKDVETLELKYLMQYLVILNNICSNNFEFDNLINEYIAKLLQICNSRLLASTNNTCNNIIKNGNQPIHAFIANYIKPKIKNQSFPTLDTLIKSLLYTKSNKTVAMEYIKKMNNLPCDIPINDILRVNKELLYDNFSVNEQLIAQIDISNKDFYLSESNHYGYYKVLRSIGTKISTFNWNINNITIDSLISLVNKINKNLTSDGDYRCLFRYKDTLYAHCLFAITGDKIDFETNLDDLSAIITSANEITWAFTASQSRQLLYVMFDNMIRFNRPNLPILVKNCFYRLYNTVLRSQLPLFRITHPTYQLSLVYNLIKYDKLIKEEVEELDIKLIDYSDFIIYSKKYCTIGPLVASSWFAKLSGLDMSYEYLDYGLGAYYKIELLDHPLSKHGLDTLMIKSKDLLSNNLNESVYSKFLGDKPEIIRLIVEGTLKYF